MRLIGYGRCVDDREREVLVAFLRAAGCTAVYLDIAAIDVRRDQPTALEWVHLQRRLRRGDRLLVMTNIACRPQVRYESLVALLAAGIDVRVRMHGVWAAPVPPATPTRGRPRRITAA